MADWIANIAKGRIVQYAQNVEDGSPANSRLKLIPLETTGIEADATLKDYDALSTLLAGATNEQTTMGRKTIAAADITITVDDTNDRCDVDLTDQTWSAATGNAISALLLVYFPDGVTPGADSTAIPLCKWDFAVTLDGSDVVAVINASGAFRAS
jgi:hypothetical protein